METITMQVSGMSCAACEQRLAAAVNRPSSPASAIRQRRGWLI